MGQVGLATEFADRFVQILAPARKIARAFNFKNDMYYEVRDCLTIRGIDEFKVTHGVATEPYETANIICQKIRGTEQMESAVACLVSSRQIRQHLSKSVGGDQVFDCMNGRDIVENALGYFLAKNRSLNSNRQLITRIARKIEEHFSRHVLECTYSIYLENIDFPRSRTKISDSIEVVTLSCNDIAATWNTSKIFRSFYSGHWINDLRRIRAKATFTIQRSHDTDSTRIPSHLSETEWAEYQLQRLEWTLRVSTPTLFDRSPVVWVTHQMPFHNHEIDIQFRNNEYHKYRGAVGCCKTTPRELNLIFNNLETATSRIPALDSVMSRMHAMSLRYGHEDTIIDTYICFEQLLRACTAEQDLHTNSASIALFIAQLVGANSHERKFVYDTVLAGYGIRNRIMHAKKPKRNEVETTREVKRILRAALRRVIICKQLHRQKYTEWLFGECAQASQRRRKTGRSSV